MAVTTWTFNAGLESWTIRDESTPGSFSAITWDSGTKAMQQEAFVPNAAGSLSRGWMLSPDDINATITPGDTIAMDVSALTFLIGGPANTTRRVKAIYTDLTEENTSAIGSGATTVTLTLTQSKTLKQIELVAVEVSNGGFPISYNWLCDTLEVRLTTAIAVEATKGKLRTPKAFIEDEGPGAAGGPGGGGNLADISADGQYIYIASFNSLGFPELIRMSTELDIDGDVVFSPGTGGRIGVQAGRFNATHAWIAGAFSGTDTVEKSEDSGDTWTVKDDGSFGTIRTFEVGPTNDETILIFDGDNSDIIETTDDGATWTTHNAATAVLLNSVARLDVNPEEIASVNVAGAANGAFYSINTGVNLEDIDDATYPNEEGTRVVVF